MLIVDSSVWIDYFNGRIIPETDYLYQALSETPIVVGDIILAEVLQGFRSDTDFEAARIALGKFQQVNMVNLILAVRSASNYRILRQNGFTVRKTIDSLIATYCIEYGYDLLHNDSDYEPYEKYLGLRVIHPL